MQNNGNDRDLVARVYQAMINLDLEDLLNYDRKYLITLLDILDLCFVLDYDFGVEELVNQLKERQ